MEAAEAQEAKLARLRQWLQVNGVELRGCDIRYCDSRKGFGVFSSNQSPDGVLLVVPLDLAITPMRVLQDPTLGRKCRAMYEEGDVDDRFLMILYLIVERLRRNSSWAPYLDVLPITFGTSLWFSEDELSELKGTTLHRATKLQKEKLQELFVGKVRQLVEELLAGELEREVLFEDFLWANSIFWTRALNIPLPSSYIFPPSKVPDNCFSNQNKDTGAASSEISTESLAKEDKKNAFKEDNCMPSASTEKKTIWVEGLVPGIDFCNHDLKASATWEVDDSGSRTGVPFSMYLLSAEQGPLDTENEIRISYGNKGNEELLYLYGFVLENNPDDYLMVHYPMEALQNDPSADFKAQLLQVQQAEMRCLLPRNLLDHGFFGVSQVQDEKKNKSLPLDTSKYSWSGMRKVPSYLTKLVFPEEFLAALRTVAMKEDEQFQVSALLEDLVGPDGERQPSETEVRAAIWEVCGDSGAFQLLFDLLQAKMLELEEGTGTEDVDAELLENAEVTDIPMEKSRVNSGLQNKGKKMNRNRWSAIIYRQGQKRRTRLFLKEAEQALQMCLTKE